LLPDVPEVFDRKIHSGGIRETCRRLPMSRCCFVRKSRKIERHLRGLHQNLLHRFPAGAQFSFDELVTYEQNRVTQPLSLPILVEMESHFVVAATVARMAPLLRTVGRRQQRIAAAEQSGGRRRSTELLALRHVLATLVPLVAGHRRLYFRTDMKAVYPRVLRSLFGAERVVHEREQGKPGKAPLSPLFAINLTAAMLRDLEPRLRRRSWLAAKKAEWLEHALPGFLVYRNCVRRRFNREGKQMTPAVHLGFLQRALAIEECVRWRQDFGMRSLHPTGLDGRLDWRGARSMQVV
jgi:hypothetical protein